MLPGLLLCTAVAVVAFVFGRELPIVGGPVFGIVLGLLIAVVRKPDVRFAPGIRFASKTVLQLSIILLGVNLQLGEIVGGGLRSLPLMLGTLALVLTAAFFLGKALGLNRDLRRLLGAGTAVCGGSAIAAVSSVCDIDQADTAYAISAVFLFNLVAVLVFPAAGHALGLSQHAFGVWAGTAVNDTSSVVAAAFVYGHAAGDEAVIVKLTRTTLIIPIVIFYAGKRIFKARASGESVDWMVIIPWFILWFIVAAAINSLIPIPAGVHGAITQTALFLIIVALSGVGLSANAAAIRAAGLRPLLLGFILWALIACSSLAYLIFGGANAIAG